MASSPEILLDLIYNEIVVREELGEEISLEDYVASYPQLERDLRLHFEVHRALRVPPTRDVAARTGLHGIPAMTLGAAQA